MAALKDLDPN